MEFYVDEENEQEIRLYAEYVGRSVSNLIRFCVKSEMARRSASFEKWRKHTKGAANVASPRGEINLRAI
jgi:hypothetical protein